MIDNKMKKVLKIAMALLISLSFLTCNNNETCFYTLPTDIKDGLKVSNLKKLKLDTVGFKKLNQDICNGRYGKIHSLLALVEEKLVIEQYYNGWKEDDIHFLASNTKSFNSILMGIAIEKGFIKDVNQKMLSFFPEYAKNEKDSLKHNVTIEHLLTMTAGFKWDEQTLTIHNPENMGVVFDKTDDWLQSALTLEMDTVSGTKYVYSGPSNIIISEIIKKATGQNIADFAKKHLFNPLGIKEYKWDSKNGVYDSGGGLWLKSRDVAKFALLHFTNGKWGGREIVSGKWMEQTFNPHVEINLPRFGGYQWQIIKAKDYHIWFIPGNGGQIISIIPALNLVVVLNADNREVSKDNRDSLENLMMDITKMATIK